MRSVLLVLLVVAAGCASAQESAPTTTTAPTTTVAPTTTPDPTTTVASTTTAATTTTTTTAPTTTVAATAATTTTTDAGAAGSFSPDHLMLGAGSWFESADDPEFVPAGEAHWLEPDDVVLGIVHGGEALALPVDQMSYHHIANLEVAGEPYLVTY